MSLPLFDDDPAPAQPNERLGTQAVLLRGFALPQVDALWPALQAVIAQGRKLDFGPGSTLIHGGGWKRLQDQQVNNATFKALDKAVGEGVKQ